MDFVPFAYLKNALLGYCFFYITPKNFPFTGNTPSDAFYNVIMWHCITADGLLTFISIRQICCRKFYNWKSVPVIWIGLFRHQACGFLQAPIRSMEQLYTFLQQICRMWIHPLGYVHRGRIAANPQNKICMRKNCMQIYQSKIRNKSPPIGTDFILWTRWEKKHSGSDPCERTFFIAMLPAEGGRWKDEKIEL